MSILTKREILERITSGNIGFTPKPDSFQVQDHSIDLRLGFTFMVPKMWRLTPQGRESLFVSSIEKQGPEYFDIIELEQGQYFDLLPQEHVLVSSYETLKIPDDMMSILYPRLSTNRKGLSLDLTGIINAGYEGQLTLPIRNNTHSQIIRLYPGERFCQIVFEELTEKVGTHQGRYHRRDIVDGVAAEKKDEIAYIIKGDIKKLKAEHPINIESETKEKNESKN